MIIVEGPDGAGKTTLIQKLTDITGFPVAERVVSKETKALFDLKAWVENNLDTGADEVIYDRYRLVSEFIYGPVLRVEQQPGFVDLDWTLDMLSKLYEREPIIVYCLPPLEVVRANLMGDKDNEAVFEFIEAIYTAYLQRASLDAIMRPTRTILYDYTDDGLYEGDIEGQILGLMADRKAKRSTP